MRPGHRSNGRTRLRASTWRVALLSTGGRRRGASRYRAGTRADPGGRGCRVRGPAMVAWRRRRGRWCRWRGQ